MDRYLFVDHLAAVYIFYFTDIVSAHFLAIKI